MLPRIRNSGEFRSQLKKKLLMTTGKYSSFAYLPFARRTRVYFFKLCSEVASACARAFAQKPERDKTK